MQKYNRSATFFVCQAETETAAVSQTPLPLSTASIVAAARLDRHTYAALLAEAAALYGQGYRRLQIDLRQTVRIEQSGLFALYCVHLIFQGERPPDPAAGMGAIREVTERVALNGNHPVSLCNAPSYLRPLIKRAGFRLESAV